MTPPTDSVTDTATDGLPQAGPRPPAARVLGPTARPGLGHTPRAVTALIIREMSTTYGRSPMGYVWAIAEPVAGIMLLAAIFSLGFRSPSIGTNFALFYASGLLPFFFFNDINSKTAQALRFNRSLLFYPRVTFLDAILARLILNGLTQTMVTILVLTGITLAYSLPTIYDYPQMALALAMAMSLGLGVGMMNCYLFTLYPTWQRFWSILTRPLFILSCVLFLFDTVPQPYRDWLWWNPLIHVVGQMRGGIYPTYDASYVSLTYVLSLSAGLSLLGLLLLQRYHRDIANN